MPTPNEKLAESLERLREVEKDGILPSSALTRVHRERLLRAGFIAEVMKGWYRVSDPGLRTGDTNFYAFYWAFVRRYLAHRFGERYRLAAEPSLLLHAASPTIPRQVGVLTLAGGNSIVPLPGDLSLLIYQDAQPNGVEQLNGLNIMPLPEALARVGEGFFRNRPDDASILLRTVADPSPLLALLLDGGRSTIAGRLAGAFRANRQGEIADDILAVMKRAGYDVREANPFERPVAEIAVGRNPTPHELRIRTMWSTMRDGVTANFPPAPGLPSDTAGYLRAVDDQYVSDAYNSLSIEGYRVTTGLIEKVRGGVWDPHNDPADRETRDALAARGYFEAFTLVRTAVERLVSGEDPAIVRRAHRDWHGALFAPAVTAGILRPSDLAGYRNHPVYIQGSRHVPPRADGVASAMDTLFDLLGAEPEASVRAVLGHFIFVFIHPYGDGNGRLGRFLMNAMLSSGGYPWTVVRLENRRPYMEALEAASVNGDIAPFARFIASEMQGE